MMTSAARVSMLCGDPRLRALADPVIKQQRVDFRISGIKIAVSGACVSKCHDIELSLSSVSAYY
jgi:hypothetical protein